MNYTIQDGPLANSYTQALGILIDPHIILNLYHERTFSTFILADGRLCIVSVFYIILYVLVLFCTCSLCLA